MRQLFMKLWLISWLLYVGKFNYKQTIQRIIIILTPIEPETVQVFFSYITNAQCVYLGWYGRKLTDNPIHSTHVSAYHDQSGHSCGDTVAKFLKISGDWRHKNSVFFKSPQKNRKVLNLEILSKASCSEHTYSDHSWGYLPQPGTKRRGEGILWMEDAGTSEKDDIDSQDSNISIDHGNLARNCSIKIINFNK